MTTAVIGATGRVGSEIVRGLLGRDGAVVALVRDPDKARRGVSLRSRRRFGGWLAHGADPPPDRSLTGHACLIVVRAFRIGSVWGGRQAQVLVRIVAE